MGTIVVGAIIDEARATLIDVSGTPRWSRTAEMLVFANDAQKEIVIGKPDAGAKSAVFQLAAGASQTIPADGVQFMGVEHNLGVAGTTPGRATLIADRADLSGVDPQWMTATGAAVEHFIHDQRNPLGFYVYPRPTGAWYVSLLYAAVPPTIPAANIDTAAIGVSDIYKPAIHDYIVARALLKNSRSGDVAKASFFFNKFYAQIGRKMQAQSQYQPLDADAAKRAPDALGKA